MVAVSDSFTDCKVLTFSVKQSIMRGLEHNGGMGLCMPLARSQPIRSATETVVKHNVWFCLKQNNMI